MTSQKQRLRLVISLSTTKNFTTGSTQTNHPNKLICTQNAGTRFTNWASTSSTFLIKGRKKTLSQGWISGTTQNSIGHQRCPDPLCIQDKACSTILKVKRKSVLMAIESSKCLTTARVTSSMWHCSFRCQKVNLTLSVEFASPKNKWTTWDPHSRSTLWWMTWTLRLWWRHAVPC